MNNTITYQSLYQALSATERSAEFADRKERSDKGKKRGKYKRRTGSTTRRTVNEMAGQKSSSRIPEESKVFRPIEGTGYYDNRRVGTGKTYSKSQKSAAKKPMISREKLMNENIKNRIHNLQYDTGSSPMSLGDLNSLVNEQFTKNNSPINNPRKKRDLVGKLKNLSTRSDIVPTSKIQPGPTIDVSAREAGIDRLGSKNKKIPKNLQALALVLGIGATGAAVIHAKKRRDVSRRQKAKTKKDLIINKLKGYSPFQLAAKVAEFSQNANPE